MTEDSYYRPGLIFLSKHAALGVPLKEPVMHTYPDGTREQVRPQLWADFSDGYGNSLMSRDFAADESGRPLPRNEVYGIDPRQPYSFPGDRADIRGGVFDLDEYASRMGLTDDEKETCARNLLKRAYDQRDTTVTLWEPPIPTAPIPNWENLSEARVLAIAAELGVIAEALHYERRTANRPDLVASLEKKLQRLQEEQSADEALSAA